MNKLEKSTFHQLKAKIINILKNCKDNCKRDNGITLSVLVVTIIVLLILAGITISFSLGENGIIAKAKNAAEKYKQAEIDEQMQLNSLYSNLSISSSNGNTNVTIEEVSNVVEKVLDDKLNEKMLKQYPVGSIYISENSTNPKEFIGGEWEQVKDRFLLSAGDKYTAGSAGGEEKHTLTVEEMPSHTHESHLWTFSGDYGNTGTYYGLTYRTDGFGGGKIKKPNDDKNKEVPFYNLFSGGSQPHNNMPPYLTVYVWKRVS